MWYSASLLSKGTHREQKTGADDPLWEESIVLLQAESEADARQKAERAGMEEQMSFKAISGEVVDWDFVGVTKVHEILDQSLKEGTELFSRFLRDSEVKIVFAKGAKDVIEGNQ